MSMETTVIDKVWRDSNDWWFATGHRFYVSGRSYAAAITKGDWHGSTQYDELAYMLPTCYMTKSCWDGLPIGNREQIKNNVIAVISAGYVIQYTKTGDDGTFYCREFDTSSIIPGYKESTLSSTPDVTPPTPIPNTVIYSDPAPATCVASNPRSDINRDGIVDELDQAIMQGAYGTSDGDVTFDPLADINQDGNINFIDIGMLGTDFGCTVYHADEPTPIPGVPDYVNPMPTPSQSDDDAPIVLYAFAAIIGIVTIYMLVR